MKVVEGDDGGRKRKKKKNLIITMIIIITITTNVSYILALSTKNSTGTQVPGWKQA